MLILQAKLNKSNRMRQQILLAILLLVSITLCSFHANAPIIQPKQQKEKPLKILSWNIYMLPYTIFWRSKKTNRAKLIAKELLERDYDIIVFQEAFKRRPRRKLRKLLKKKYPYMYGPANKKFFSISTNSGIWVLSNRPLILKGMIDFDACEGIDCMARKGAMMLEGEHNGHLFQIVGTHTQGGPQIINRHQFHMIYDSLLEPFQKKGVPQIICGDMNCSFSKKKDYKAMMRIFDAENTKLSGKRRHSNWEKSAIIDYILLRRNGAEIQATRKEILRIGKKWETKIKKRTKQSLGLSDHYPIEMEIQF